MPVTEVENTPFNQGTRQRGGTLYFRPQHRALRRRLTPGLFQAAWVLLLTELDFSRGRHGAPPRWVSRDGRKALPGSGLLATAPSTPFICVIAGISGERPPPPPATSGPDFPHLPASARHSAPLPLRPRMSVLGGRNPFPLSTFCFHKKKLKVKNVPVLPVPVLRLQKTSPFDRRKHHADGAHRVGRFCF